MNSTPHAMNGATDKGRLFQNMFRILPLSLNCSSLIDVSYRALYNEPMEENAVINLISMEIAEPKRRLDRSPGAIYIILIALVLSVIALANFLYARWQVSRFLVQPPLYALIAVAAFVIYRRNDTRYRYTLTDRMFVIEQIAANRERTLVAALLRDIDGIDAKRCEGRTIRVVNAYAASKTPSVLVTLRQNGKTIAYRINPSEAFLQQLTAQWQAARAQKE